MNPGETIKTEVIEKQWDTILRVLVSIRLKESKASVIFSRLSSYAQQNPTYQAFKELGKIYKSLFVLKYYDEVKLRQMTEKQLSKMERSNQYAHAIFFDNNQEIRQELKEDQDVVVAARILIQNAIILWNCLKLSEKILLVNNQEEKVRIVRLIREGSACTWQHVNLQGIYEFVYENTSNFLKVNKREILDMKIA